MLISRGQPVYQVEWINQRLKECFQEILKWSGVSLWSELSRLKQRETSPDSRPSSHTHPILKSWTTEGQFTLRKGKKAQMNMFLQWIESLNSESSKIWGRCYRTLASTHTLIFSPTGEWIISLTFMYLMNTSWNKCLYPNRPGKQSYLTKSSTKNK